MIPPPAFGPPTSSLLTAREGATDTLLPNGKVLVVGGDQVNDVILASAELYDPISGQWTAAGTMRNARADHSATLLANGKVLVAGGFGVEDVPINVELYDPATGVWTSTIPLITGRQGHSAFRLSNGKVLLVGGFNFNDQDSSATSELYDPANAVARAYGLTDPWKLPSGEFRFAFNNTPGLTFSVLSAPDPTMTDGSWVNLGQPTEVLPGIYEFTDSSVANSLGRFYRVRSR